MSKKSKSLQKQVKQKIGLRVILTFAVLLMVVIGFTANNMIKSVTQLEESLTSISEKLQGFVIDQVFVKNYPAITEKINSINKHNNFKLTWVPNGSANNARHIRIILPFSWRYEFQLLSINNLDFGYFKVSGSFLDENSFIRDLTVRSLLLILFLGLGFILLYPLITRIPKKLFLDPVMDILTLLESGKHNESDTHDDKVIEISRIEHKVTQLIKEAQETSKTKAFSELASQVAHDIRSPVTALNAVLQNVCNIPEEQRIAIRSATHRINDIANNLLRQHKGLDDIVNESYSTKMLFSLIDNIISEKRNVIPKNIKLKVHVTEADRFICANVQEIEFSRILSNVINNAVEAIEAGGEVIVSLTRYDKQALVTVADDGVGIPNDQLMSVLEQGFSHGKKNGSGLGLYHAKRCIESWGGDISISSTLNEGTTVSLSLPSAPLPQWLPRALTFAKGATVVILDDDDSIHCVWRQRLQALVEKKDLATPVHCKSSHELYKWHAQSRCQKNIYYLFDYELIGDSKNGLEILQDIESYAESTLVTSHFEEPGVINACLLQGIDLLPKSLSVYIPIKIIPTQVDAVLIDDDPAIRMAWKMKAKQSHLELLCFTEPREFERLSKQIIPTTPIYIDSTLSGDQKGEKIAKRYFQMGFTEIYLATGHDPREFKKMPWIKRIIGKNPSFS